MHKLRAVTYRKHGGGSQNPQGQRILNSSQNFRIRTSDTAGVRLCNKPEILSLVNGCTFK